MQLFAPGTAVVPPLPSPHRSGRDSYYWNQHEAIGALGFVRETLVLTTLTLFATALEPRADAYPVAS